MRITTFLLLLYTLYSMNTFFRNLLIELLSSAQNNTVNIYDIIADQCGTESFEGCALMLGTYIQYALWINTFVFGIAFLGTLLIFVKRPLGNIIWLSWFMYQFIAIAGFIFASLLLPGIVRLMNTNVFDYMYFQHYI